MQTKYKKTAKIVVGLKEVNDFRGFFVSGLQQKVDEIKVQGSLELKVNLS